ncbi:MAG: CotH kinase family protein [Myxococcota bacterium]
MHRLVVGPMALLCACVDTPGVGPERAVGDDDAGPDYAAVFGADSVHHISLRMDAADHAAMYAEMSTLTGTPFGGGGTPSGEPPVLYAGSPSWFPVEVEVDEVVWEGVGFRLKGNSTLRAAWESGIRKLPFRLDFDQLVGDGVGAEDQRLYGFEELTFSNGFRDPTLMRDVLASAVLEDRGVPAARAAYWWVTLDSGAGPAPLGLYVATELPEDTLVARIWGTDAGALYKPDGPCATLTCDDAPSFEAKTDTADGADVTRLVTALNADRTDPEAWRTALEATLDVDAFLRWLAVNSAMRNWDAYGVIAHNYYLYAPPDDGRLNWIPWDHNEAFTDWPAPTEDPLLSTIDEQWPLIRLLLDDPGYREAYRLHLLNAIEGAYAREAFEERVDALADLLRPVLFEGPGEPADATFLGTEAEFDEAVRVGLLGLAEARREEVRAAAGAR